MTCTCVQTFPDGESLVADEPCLACRVTTFTERERLERLTAPRVPHCRCCSGRPSLGLPEGKRFL